MGGVDSAGAVGVEAAATAAIGLLSSGLLLAARAALAQARTALQEARAAFDAENYLESAASLQGVREKLDAGLKPMESIPLRPRPRGGKGRKR